ncbi:MAG: cadherin repeat domain-containing protein, partial [Cyanobacteria bacterium J06592_8]
MTIPIQNLIATYDNLPENTEDQYTAQEVNPPQNTLTHDFQVGDENNLQITGFTSTLSENYDLLSFVDQINIQRVDNDQAQGERQIIWFEQQDRTNDSLSLKPSLATTMEETLLSSIINRGSDNIFTNVGNEYGNNNNIERLDLVSIRGFSSPEIFLDEIGFLILERGGNDRFKVAAITAVDDQGNPTEFGPLQEISADSWGQSSYSVLAEVMRQDPNEDNLRSTTKLGGTQAIAGLFISFADLEVTDDQIFYGFSIFPPDVDESNDLIGLTDFPTDTPEEDNQGNSFGNLDLISAGRIFVRQGVNIPPKITSNGGGETAELTLAENITDVTDVEATDDIDVEQDGLTYSISGGEDRDSLTIDPITGELRFNQPPDFENPGDVDGDNRYQVEVTVTDSQGLTDTQLLNINVGDEDENSNPQLETEDITISENTTDVTDLDATDDNDSEGDGLTYSISGGEDRDSLTIDPITGEL